MRHNMRLLHNAADPQNGPPGNRTPDIPIALFELGPGLVEKNSSAAFADTPQAEQA